MRWVCRLSMCWDSFSSPTVRSERTSVEGDLHRTFIPPAEHSGMKSVSAGAQPLTSVCVERICECPFSIAEEYAVEYLKQAEAGGSQAVIRAPIAPGAPIGRKVKLSFGLSCDITEAGRQHQEIRLLWFSGSVLFPDFRGTIRRPARPARTCTDRAKQRTISRNSAFESSGPCYFSINTAFSEQSARSVNGCRPRPRATCRWCS